MCSLQGTLATSPQPAPPLAGTHTSFPSVPRGCGLVALVSHDECITSPRSPLCETHEAQEPAGDPGVGQLRPLVWRLQLLTPSQVPPSKLSRPRAGAGVCRAARSLHTAPNKTAGPGSFLPVKARNAVCRRPSVVGGVHEAAWAPVQQRLLEGGQWHRTELRE